MTTSERVAAQMSALRCSYPPYFVGALTPDGWPVAVMSGNTYKDLERGFAPTSGEAEMMVFRLRQKLRWSRPGMAAFMGISEHVLRRWETGERHPSGAARRLIWLLDLLANEPHKLQTAMDMIFWGKREELAQSNRELFSKTQRSKKPKPVDPESPAGGTVVPTT